MIVGGGEAIPLHDIPHVADVVKRIYDRPPWQRNEPLTIAPELFEQARAEYADVLQRRGWALPTAEMNRENFLIKGVTVVMGDECASDS